MSSGENSVVEQSTLLGFYIFLAIILLLFLIATILILYAFTGNCRAREYEHLNVKTRLSRDFLSNQARPYKDEEDSEEERDQTLHYYKEAVMRSESSRNLKHDKSNHVNEEETDPNEIIVLDSSLTDALSSPSSMRGKCGSFAGAHQPSIVVSRCGDNSVGTESPFSVNSSPTRNVNLLGKLMISALYMPDKEKLEITLREGHDLALPDQEATSQVRLALLPDKRQKFKTTVVKGPNPKFDQSFVFTNVAQDRLSELVVRFRAYRPLGLSKRDQLMGEAALRLCLIDARARTCTHHLLDLSLKNTSTMVTPSVSDFSVNSRRGSMVDSTGRFCSQPAGMIPELLVNLCFNDLTGKLVVGIEKGSCFGIHSKTPDTMIKVTVLSAYGEEIGKSKTGIKKSVANPVYSETFVFQVPNSELQYISVLVQVYCFVGVWRRRVLLGWISLGQSSTSPMQEEHWNEMIAGMGISVTKWHVLVEP